MMHMQPNDELFDFLLQASKQFRMEELINRNTQTVTQLLDRGHSRAVVSAANDVVYGRLRNATNTAQFVDGDISFLA